MFVIGLLLTVIMPEARLDNVLPAGPKITTSKWEKNAAEPRSKHTRVRVVLKTVISSKLHMSVLVGLEGSGNHYMMEMIIEMFRTNGQISNQATPCLMHRLFLTLKSMESSTWMYSQVLEEAKAEMHDLAIQEPNLPWPGHLARLCMDMSYLSGIGARKVMHCMDLHVVAKMAEEEGVGLRVVYLKRSDHDILVANTIHRNFQE